MEKDSRTRVDYKLRDFISGMPARRYRKKLARLSDNPSDSMLTLKFRLDLPEGFLKRVSFDEFRQLYDTVEGTGPGSLAYLLFTLITQGFRIFPKAGGAGQFANRHAFDDRGFHAAVEKQLGIDMPEFVPSKISSRLETEVRAAKGKDNRFCKEVIVREYVRSLGKKFADDDKRLIQEDLFSRIADELLKDFSGWAELKKDKAGACRCVDRAMASFKGGSFPSISSMVAKVNSSLPENSTLAFDADAPLAQCSDEDLPYFAVAAVLHRLDGMKADPKDLPRFVQDNMTTRTNSGLSWLFGKGLAVLKTLPEEELSRRYGVPEEKREAVRKVQEAARQVPDQALLRSDKGGAMSYSVFRSSLGGRLDSWIANYIKRLCELKDLLEALPEQIRLPAGLIVGGRDFLETTDCSREEAEALCTVFTGVRKAGLAALNRMLGVGAGLRADDIESVRQTLELENRLFCIGQQIENALDQAEKDEKGGWSQLKKSLSDSWDDWRKLARLPKLNQQSGGVPNAEKELQAASQALKTLAQAQKQHFSRIAGWLKDQGLKLDPLKAETARQEELVKKRGQAARERLPAEEMALRSILQKIGSAVRYSRDDVSALVKAWFKAQGLFETEKLYNKFFCNFQGRIYVSPFSSGRHQGMALNPAAASRGREILDSFKGLLEQAEALAERSAGARETYWKLQKLWMQLLLGSVDCMVPVSLAKPDIPAQFAGSIPADLHVMLARDSLPMSGLIKIFNLYSSLISGLNILLRRERFFLRTKFSWVGNCRLFYVPKDGLWRMPERYRKSAAWKPVLEGDVLAYGEGGDVDVRATFAKMRSKFSKLPAEMSPLLLQLPHDWCYVMPAAPKTGDAKVEALRVQKEGASGTTLAFSSVSLTNAARLIGPSSYKGRLDSLLLPSSRETVSDMMLLADQQVNQGEDPDGGIVLERSASILSLAVPFSSPASKPAEAERAEALRKAFRRFVAIDQGENGLAYAVFDMKDAGCVAAEPLVCGTVRIPSIRRLINSVRKFRTAGQKVQKFNQRFDSSLFNLRENVAGDVCGVIAGLMQRFSAIPVLEYQVKNLESGSKQLSLVYKAVNARFLHSSVEMQNNERKAWWAKGDAWSGLGFLKLFRQKDLGRKPAGLVSIGGQDYAPLKAYPGVSVDARNTSRICSRCGRNVFDLISGLEQEGCASVKVGPMGRIRFGSEVIQLFEKPGQEERRRHASRNENAPLTRPLREGNLPVRDLKARVKFNLRRPPKSKQTKDTTQSRYFCVFEDCAWHGREQHADINAAVNIGRRLLSELIRDPAQAESLKQPG